MPFRDEEIRERFTVAVDRARPQGEVSGEAFALAGADSLGVESVTSGGDQSEEPILAFVLLEDLTT